MNNLAINVRLAFPLELTHYYLTLSSVCQVFKPSHLVIQWVESNHIILELQGSAPTTRPLNSHVNLLQQESNRTLFFPQAPAAFCPMPGAEYYDRDNDETIQVKPNCIVAQLRWKLPLNHFSVRPFLCSAFNWYSW